MRKKIGDIGEDLVLLGGIAVLGYFILQKFLPDFGAGFSKNNSGSDDAASKAAAADLAASQAAGSQQSLSSSSIAGMASSINQYLQQLDFWGNPSPDLSSAVQQVLQCQTATDWFALVSAFGTKAYNTGGTMSLCSWIAVWCTNLNLPAALQAAITWDKQNDADDASTQVGLLNGLMQNLGVAQTFTI